ncbi:hypothetical protein NDI76_19175 [Halogeometricum sp. S1BR25-6]|uniref:Uncharacterized protein n=1 Tax=Halogeometricum salsisoli TaxID=2950536 RepID=A0ABU2GKD8_9EURY|nr:hypothetical protein [Halogeometricum sp. S1BR25-6]MDS0300876.1 hypothetical protein [Halogeometricum sp. S1BR25-6]
MDSSDPWYRGALVPDRDGDWRVTAVARRSLASEETFVCEATGAAVPASSTHLLVTVRRRGRFRDKTDEFVVLDEDTLRRWLEVGD